MTKTGRPSCRDKILVALPGTRTQLAKKSGASSASVGKWVAILRAEGLIRIGGWRRSHMGAKQPILLLAPVLIRSRLRR